MVTFDPSLNFNHTCLRIKDPKVSTEFYQKNFGMKLIKKFDVPEKKIHFVYVSFGLSKE